MSSLCSNVRFQRFKAGAVYCILSIVLIAMFQLFLSFNPNHQIDTSLCNLESNATFEGTKNDYDSTYKYQYV